MLHRCTNLNVLGIPVFLACWYLYDCKNPAKRNPERWDFYKALKGLQESREQEYHCISKESVLTLETQLKKSPSSSLNRIQNLSDVGDELVEIKNANGKVFYVEDNKSENSTATLGSNPESPSREDEQSVIAMLDDVLNAQDTQQGQQDLDLQQQMIFERHFSLDSEMYPSVIETVIVATVHSSSDDDEVQSGITLKLSRYDECKLVAHQMLEEMFNSEAFYEQLEKVKAKEVPLVKGDKLEGEAESVNDDEASKPVFLFQRLGSQTSIISQASTIEDPLHSTKFKDRLSHIIMNANAHQVKVVAKRSEDVDGEVELEPVPDEEPKTRPLLKQSKSETDVRRLMLKAISELKIDRNETGNADEVPAEVSTTTGNPSKDPVPGAGPIAAPVAAAGGSNIPRPPKFDPVLYKTINSISLRKQRPSLNRQHIVDAKNPALLRPESQTETRPDPGEQPEPEPLPFKAKLEAILQRGPSHRTQQHPDLVRRQRPQSTYIEMEEVESWGGSIRTCTLRSPMPPIQTQ